MKITPKHRSEDRHHGGGKEEKIWPSLKGPHYEFDCKIPP